MRPRAEYRRQQLRMLPVRPLRVTTVPAVRVPAAQALRVTTVPALRVPAAQALRVPAEVRVSAAQALRVQAVPALRVPAEMRVLGVPRMTAVLRVGAALGLNRPRVESRRPGGSPLRTGRTS